MFKATAPPAAEKTLTPGQANSKSKDNPTPSKEDRPQSGKTDQQVTIPGMGDPTPAARDVEAKGKPP